MELVPDGQLSAHPIRDWESFYYFFYATSRRSKTFGEHAPNTSRSGHVWRPDVHGCSKLHPWSSKMRYCSQPEAMVLLWVSGAHGVWKIFPQKYFYLPAKHQIAGDSKIFLQKYFLSLLRLQWWPSRALSILVSVLPFLSN